MPCAINDDLEICKGSTFSRIYRWESFSIVFVPIINITQSAPPIVTAIDHGIPDNWRVAITSVKGMTEINSKHSTPRPVDFQRADVLTTSTFRLPRVDASMFKPYIVGTSGGTVRYFAPMDLTGFTALMHIRQSISSVTPLLILSTSNGRIIFNPVLFTITLMITAADTAALTFTSGVFDLELMSGTEVTRLVEGNVIVTDEVTR